MKNKERLRKIFNVAVPLAITLLVVYFFSSEFKKNWDDIIQLDFSLNMPLLICSFFLVVLAYISNTLTWRQLVNSYHPGRNKISIRESISIVNITQLGKYIPGKVWSYAMQIYWLSKKGYPRSNVLFINIVATLSTLLAASSIGMLILAFAGKDVIRQYYILIILSVVVSYVVFIFFHTPLINLVIKMASKVLKKEIVPVQISALQIFKTQLFYIITNIIYGFGIYLLCKSTGISSSVRVELLIAGAFLVGDVVGFLFIIVPGGLGVRESFMFFVIAGLAQREIAIIMPLATRLLTMTTDFTMGFTGLVLRKRMIIPNSS